MNELLIYTLTTLIAVSTGVTFGAASASPVRVLATVAGMLSTLAVIVAAFAVGTAAPWMAPLFAVVAGVTALLVAAGVRTAEPGLIGEPYWRRVSLIAFHNGRLRTVESN